MELNNVINAEMKIVKQLTKITDDNRIQYHDDGFLSRGYVIDKGLIVFKFPKKKDVKYDNEISIIDFINEQSFNVNLQKVGWISKDNLYLGIYGVVGNSIEGKSLSEEEQRNIGSQLGGFLKGLHKSKLATAYKLSLKDEITSWQMRYKSVENFIRATFTVEEWEKIENLIMNYVPSALFSFGENLVFSHGDLGDGNIFVDSDGKIGIIDFNESGYFDEAADFMDVKSDKIRDSMLSSYEASDALIKKVELRKDIRPIIVLDSYLERGDQEIIEELIIKIKQTLSKYKNVLD